MTVSKCFSTLKYVFGLYLLDFAEAQSEGSAVRRMQSEGVGYVFIIFWLGVISRMVAAIGGSAGGEGRWIFLLHSQKTQLTKINPYEHTPSFV